jgi:hypothetical protein
MANEVLKVEGFAEYSKIDTLFERDKATFVVDPLRIKSPVLRRRIAFVAGKR